MTLSTAEYLVGFAFFIVTVGGSGVAALLVLQKRLPRLTGATRWLAWSVLATAALLVVHLVPGALGILSRWSAGAAALVLVAVAGVVPVAPAADGVGFPEDDDHRDDDTERGWGRWLARYGIAAGAAWLAVTAFVQRNGALSGFDAASAYMPTAARWIQEGSIWGFGDWVPGFFFGTSPGNGSTVVLAWMLPWENDFLARYAIFPFLPMVVLATYCLAREARARPSLAALLALAVTAVPVVVEPAARDALLDPVLYATFAAGLTFLLRHHRTGDPADLAVGGVALGIAFGTKLYGFTAVPLMVGLWVVARLVASRPVQTVLRQAAAVVGLVAAFGGVWVLRNTIETGNPLYPVAVGPLGLDAPPDPYRELLGSSLLDYVDQPDVWKDELVHQFRVAAGAVLLLLGAAVVAAVVLAVRRRTDRGTGLVGLAGVAVLGLSYMATPYSAVGLPGDPFIAAANVRYGVPALLCAVGLAGWVTSRLPSRAVLVVEVAALLAFVDALQVGTVLTGRQLVVVLVVAVPLALAAVMAGGWLDRVTALPIAVRAGAVALLAVLAVVGIGRYEDHYNSSRFAGLDPALDWLEQQTEDGATIGIAGAWTDQGVAPIYPAFGDRLQNDVTFIGRRVDGLLAHHPDESAYVDALERSAVAFLVLGRAEPYGLDPATTPTSAQVEAWSISAGYEPVAQSDRFTVLAAPSG
ncbi:MAG: phospholipid carrier-dependent glycosyltransferase [Actinomycetota bacterium]|nr:phospholipid carrier-dependent glycosyltransferase [Actinomycetota bacterium]